MRKLIVLTVVLLTGTIISAQSKYLTKNGHIGFYSHTTMEDIKGDNNQVASIIDIEKGDILFTILMKSFKFDRALMEEHFNENYAESDKFPKASFKGKITNLAAVDFKKSGTYNVDVEGDMTIHGVTKPQTAKGTIEVKGENLLAKAKFNISLKEYGIVIPDLVKDKILDSMEITVDMDYALMKK
jgi:polyisoprenoid-binding protein YceI